MRQRQRFFAKFWPAPLNSYCCLKFLTNEAVCKGSAMNCSGFSADIPV